MANLPETPDYPAGIYQLETSDPVLGGAGGIANRQGEQLANRTAWLKAKVDAFIDGTVSVLKATKLATARTLSISGAASGSASFDGSANANIALTLADSGAVAGTYPKVTINAKGLVTGGAALVAADIPSLDWSKINSGKPTTLGGYGITDAAPLASPAFTGNPTAPTPPQFDADSSVATMEAVRRELGSMSGAIAYSAATTLTAADAGRIVRFGNSGYTVTLPLADAALPPGVSFWLMHTGLSGKITFQCQAADRIAIGGAYLTSFTLDIGDSVLLVKQLNGEFTMFYGPQQMLASATFKGSRGVQRFTANGSFTVPDGVTKIYVTGAGGGGGGGGGYSTSYAGEGGGGGAYALRQPYTVAPGQVLAITIGAGGTPGVVGGAGGAGGSTSIGALLTMPGGQGGNPGTSVTAGASGGFGGSGASGASSGGVGFDGFGVAPGAGGGSLGFGGPTRSADGQPGSMGGGGGGGYANSTGGAGAPGIVIIEW